jgi:hypothetical protein
MADFADHMRCRELTLIKAAAGETCDIDAMFRHLSILLACLCVVAIAGAGVPRLHAMTPETGRMALVLCSDGVEKTVYMDLGDDPAIPQEDCSDCAICLAETAPGMVPSGISVTLRSARRRRGTTCRIAPSPDRRVRRPQATGPPSAAPRAIRPKDFGKGANAAEDACGRLTIVNTGTAAKCHRIGRDAKDARR